MLAATIGVFDGVHKGHQFLLDTLCHEADKRGLQPLIVVIDKDSVQRLTTPDEQNALLQRYTSNIQHYTLSDVQHLKALDFLSTFTSQLSALLMGYDHRFGSDQLDYEQLQSQITNHKLHIIPCPQGPSISSSKIRSALLAGDIDIANDMLGYNYTLSGTVVHGNGIGRTIGFPTANIQIAPCKLIPKPGVYAAITHNPSPVTALVNIGTNPTVGNSHISIEAYLPDYDGPDFYGQSLSLELTHRLRDEQHFSSLDELKAQIQQDIKGAEF